MDRRALLIGIDEYDAVRGLKGCVADAEAMAALLQENEDGSPNYGCRLLTSPGPKTITRALVRTEMSRLFDNFTGDVLFYFSGHGTPTELGGYLMTQDGTRDDPGIAMNDLLMHANLSRAREV
ncbi:MAG TPA: caspase family protein, partial [Thermoanaerobaculia bacterium]